MRLGVLLDHLGSGGAERHTLALIARAKQAGDEVVVATLSGAGEDDATLLRIEAPRSRPARDRVFAEKGGTALRDAGCDVVLGFRHCPGVDVYLPHGGLVADAIHARDAARGRVSRLKLLARSFSGKHRFFAEAEQALLGDAEGPRVICVSNALQQRMRARYPMCTDRAVVIHNGVDAEHFDPARFTASEIRADLGLEDAYLGLLLAQHPGLKGAEATLRALPEIQRLDPPFHLLVAGGRLEPGFRTLARRLGVGDRVHEVGYHADPRPLYAAADVLVHPTFHDPCSLACLEALAMGVPVITTPPNGVLELMGMRGGIPLEQPGSAEAVAVALRVLADPDLRAQTGEDARLIARAHRQDTALDRVLDVCRAAAR